jgi:hypothetical protein
MHVLCSACRITNWQKPSEALEALIKSTKSKAVGASKDWVSAPKLVRLRPMLHTAGGMPPARVHHSIMKKGAIGWILYTEKLQHRLFAIDSVSSFRFVALLR